MPPGSLLLVALGSAVGGALRFAVGTALAPRSPLAFPTATLLVNVSGSLLLGLLLRDVRGPGDPTALRLALTVGLCGGFTTFSTFGLETVRLAQGGAPARAALYVVLSVGLSLAAVAVGLGAWRRA